MSEVSLSQVVEDSLSPPVAAITTSIAEACAHISVLTRHGGAEIAGTVNEFGDEQLEIDLAAEKTIINHLRKQEHVAVIASEEHPQELLVNENGTYSVAFDPLDGSSIIGNNWAVGSIFGIWKGNKLARTTGEELVASVVSVYGPRCTLWICCQSGQKGATEFTLDSENKWVKSDFVDSMKPLKLFAPANLRASQDNKGYSELVAYFMKEKYTLRYSGGLVPDVCQLLTRRGGVFLSPVSNSAKAKLRVLYEVMPMALLVESAGGAAVDEKCKRVLSRSVSGMDERCGLVCGEGGEVQRFVDIVTKQ